MHAPKVLKTIYLIFWKTIYINANMVESIMVHGNLDFRRLCKAFKEYCLCFDPNENLLMSDDLKQFPKPNIGQLFSFILKTKSFSIYRVYWTIENFKSLFLLQRQIF